MTGQRELISRPVLADRVKDRLVQDIIAGAYPPDARIVETQLARELGTSQAPIREALRALEVLGLVEISPFRGARVRRPGRAELLEAYVVRAELEALGARLGVPRLSDLDQADLEELGDAMRRAAAEGDRHLLAAVDTAFHARLLHVAANPTLERVWRSLEPGSRTFITFGGAGADVHWTADLHARILAALRTRDPDAVVAALDHHFAEASAHLADGWPEPPDDQPPPPSERAVSERGPGRVTRLRT